MPVSPKLAMRLALELRGLYEAATNGLIRAIAVQVGRGAQDATWQDRKLEALTLLMHDVDRTIDDLRREVPGAVERALGYAYRRGVAVASVEAEAAGITGSFGFMPDEEALTRLLSEAMRPHEQVILGIRRSVQDAYDQALVQGRWRLSSPVPARGSMRQGPHCHSSPTRASRVSLIAPVGSGTWHRMRRWRPAHRRGMPRSRATWTGSLVSALTPCTCPIRRRSATYAAPSKARSSPSADRPPGHSRTVRKCCARSLRHAHAASTIPNCTHSQSIYLPGFTEPPTDTDDADDYDLRQRQRAYERRIRKWKRRVEIEEAVTGKNDPHAKQARKKLRDVQAEFKTTGGRRTTDVR